MTAPGLLIVISGPSGTGKGTICKALFQRRPDMFFSVSATTRSPRTGEVDGREYHFLDKVKFAEMIAQDDFLEWAEVYDNQYGTPREPVFKALSEGKDVLLEIDIQGALKVREKVPRGIYIFVVPPSLESLRKRIIGRGTESMEIINKRMSKALGELQCLQEYNYVIVNDILEEAVDKVESIITAEHCRSCRYDVVEDPKNEDQLVMKKNYFNLNK